MPRHERTTPLPSSEQLEAELNRELKKRLTFMFSRCALYLVITFAIVLMVFLGVIVPPERSPL